LISSLIIFIKDLLKTLTGAVTINVILQLLLGLTQGISLLLLLPLLSLVGVLPLSSDAIAGPPWLVSMFEQLDVVWLLLLFCGLVTAHSLVRRKQNILAVVIENSYANEVRSRLYRGLCQANWTFLSNQKTSDLTHVLTIEIHRVSNMVKVFFELVCALLTVIVYIIVGLILHPGLLSITLLCGLLLFLLLRKFNREANEYGIQTQHHTRQIYANVIELFSGIKTIKSQAMESDMQSNFDQSCDELALSNKRFVIANSSTAMFHDIGNVVYVAIVVYVAVEVLQVQSAVLLLLLLIFARLMPRLSLILRLFQQLINQLPAFEIVSQLQQQCNENAEQAYLDQQHQSNAHRIAVNRHIVLKNISVNAGERMVLNSINLSLKSQSTVALVGPSGAGKSTLADVIAGLIEPTLGNVIIDDTPLNHINRLSWRYSISYVTQDPFIFHDTVANNLKWLNPKASEEELWKAMELAAAKSFVTALPKGLNTVLGDRGIKLSGGEKQRIALARALLNEPNVLILDEATSALDVENEKLIQQAIQNLHGKMMIVLIAHRLSTVRYADKIHVLERGELVESGQWDTLASDERSRLAKMLRHDT